MKGNGTNMLRFGMNVQNTTRGVSCDALRHTFSDVSYYSRCSLGVLTYLSMPRTL